MHRLKLQRVFTALLNPDSLSTYNMNLIEFPELSTNRLLLREPVMEDAASVQQLRSDKTVNRFLKRPERISLEEARQFLQKIKTANSNNESLYWAIAFRDEPQQLIGTICLWNFDFKKLTAETGFELLPQFHRKGIINEALGEVLKYCRNHLPFKTSTAFVDKQNIASARLLEKNNFRLDKEMKFISARYAKTFDCYFLSL